MTRLVLTSSSARRRQLLEDAGFAFDVLMVDIDESRLADEPAGAYAERVAGDKARCAAAIDAVALGADTIVVSDGAVLGKPATPEIATEMLSSLSGGTHEVMTGWALSRSGSVVSSGTEVTKVSFRPIREADIAAYVASGEPMDRAGAYAIQGGAGAFVAGLEGSYTNVIGLPMEAVVAALAELGITPGPG